MVSEMWDETEDWAGRIARARFMFHSLLVREIRGIGIVWSVQADDEVVIRRTETDFGAAKYKAELALQALTAGA